jgi:hypothetical protein
VPKQDGQAVNVVPEHVMVGAVRAMRVHVAPAQVGFWFNEEIESA